MEVDHRAVCRAGDVMFMCGRLDVVGVSLSCYWLVVMLLFMLLLLQHFNGRGQTKVAGSIAYVHVDLRVFAF